MTPSKKYVMATVVAGAAILFGLFFLMGDKDRTTRQEHPQQYKKMNVVQFYLHMPGNDYIIGRKDSSFSEVMDAAGTAVLSINKSLKDVGTLPEKDLGESAGTGESIQDIKSGVVSLSIWLLEPQNISTKITAPDDLEKDSYGNGVITTDRLLLVLGGRHRGTIFVRNPETGLWSAWGTEGNGFTKLADLIRTGGI